MAFNVREMVFKLIFYRNFNSIKLKDQDFDFFVQIVFIEFKIFYC